MKVLSLYCIYMTCCSCNSEVCHMTRLALDTRHSTKSFVPRCFSGTWSLLAHGLTPVVTTAGCKRCCTSMVAQLFSGPAKAVYAVPLALHWLRCHCHCIATATGEWLCIGCVGQTLRPVWSLGAFTCEGYHRHFGWAQLVNSSASACTSTDQSVHLL